MTIEEKIKSKLLSRGFTEKQLLNNRGLIGAVIEDTESEYKGLVGFVKSFIRDFETDYVLSDGTIVDNPVTLLTVNYHCALIEINKIDSL